MDASSWMRQACFLAFFVAILGVSVTATDQESDRRSGELSFRLVGHKTKLTGHAYRTVTATTQRHCSMSCLKDMCSSLNYCSQTKVCELTNTTAAKHPQDVVIYQGCSYYEVQTECELKFESADIVYQYIDYVNDQPRFEFRVQAKNDVFVALSPQSTQSGNYDPQYEIFIGVTASSFIRRCRSCGNVVSLSTPGVLSANLFRGFWVAFDAKTGKLEVGKRGDQTPFMQYVDPNPIAVKYVGFLATPGTFRYPC